MTSRPRCRSRSSRGGFACSPECSSSTRSEPTSELLRAIREAPDDDAPRVAYAESLAGRDDDRAALIVAQCALARGGLPRAESIRARRREMGLLAMNARTWAGETLTQHAIDVVFERGFVDRITIEIAKWREHQSAIFEAAPLLRTLRLRGVGGWSAGYGHDAGDDQPILDAVAHATDDERIDGLEIPEARIGFTDGEMCLRHSSVSAADSIVRYLLESKRLARLRRVELGDAGWALMAFSESPMAAGIESLVLDGKLDVDKVPSESVLRPKRLHLDTTLREIPSLPLFERVEDLRLERLVPSLASSPIAPRLRKLAGGIGMTATEIASLADAPSLAGLEELDLSATEKDQRLDPEPLAHAKRLDALRVLRLSDCMTGKALIALLRSPLAKRLEVIDVRRNKSLKRPTQDLARLFEGIVLLPDPPKRRARRAD